MLPAIQFDDDFFLETLKVRDVRADWNLTPEFEA
jgi:hypothetical protein